MREAFKAFCGSIPGSGEQEILIDPAGAGFIGRDFV